MKKKLLLAISLVALFACLFAITAFAVEVDGVYYTLDTNNKVATVSTENRTATTQIVTIPSTFEYEGATYRVTLISNDAFYGNKTVKELRILSEHITKIPASMIADTNGGALEKIYIDFSNITSIGSAAFNPSSQTNGNNPVANSFYYYDAKAFIENGTDVVITEPDFSNCTSIGSAAFQGANFEKLVIPEGIALNNQVFRMSTIKELDIKGANRGAISYYVFSSCVNLETIRIESLSSISNDVFSGCKNVKEIYINLSNCTSIGSSAFSIGNKGYDQGNTTTQWYNYQGEKIVDLSNVKTINEKAFSSSNLGSAKIIWPTALDTLSDQAFRKCNIAQPLYLNAAAGKTISVPYWCMNGNSFTFAYLGNGVTSVAARFEAACVVVCAEDSVAFSDGTVFNVAGSTLYCKAYTGTDLSSKTNVTINTITSASAQTYGACGLTASVTLTGGATQAFNYVSHNYKGVADQTVCPAGSLMVYTCTGCASSYEEKLESFIGGTHDFVIENGATVAKIVYENNNYFANGVVVIKCASCSAQNSDTEISPLFEAVGYSTNEAMNGFISHTIKVNVDVVDEYKNYTGITVQYGVMASVAASNPLTIENGKVVANGKAVAAEMSNTNYTTLLIKVHGITSNEAMNCNAYVAIDGVITYLCGDEALESPAEKSLNISNETIEGMSVEAILQETKQYA